jgi:hypothetical protein
MREMQNTKLNVQDGTATTAMVGAHQLRQLKRRWADYKSVSDPRNGPVDPVAALQRTGALLHAVGHVIISEKSADN